jgi:hypothetical protein
MIDDDELIERLRRTLQTEAAAINPSPAGQPPTPYSAPTPMPKWRDRWPLALTAAAAVAVVAAGISLAVVDWPGGGSSRIGVVSPGPATTTGATPSTVSRVASASTVASTVAPSPSTVAPSPTVRPPATTVPPATTLPAAPVPAGFAPVSVTFVSRSEGWVAGTVPCSSGSCLALARTSDGGLTWRSIAAPPLTLTTAPYPLPNLSVRFADPLDGWVYAFDPSHLWSTHDGGRSWHRDVLPGLTSQTPIVDLEAASGHVDVVFYPENTPTVHVDSAPVGADTWTDTDTVIPVGAGPVPSTQLVLQQSRAWLLQNDRFVVGGAQLNSSGKWTAWNPPCTTANGVAALAASTPANLVALCGEGEWGPARNLPAGAHTPSTWLFRSSDGGASFQAVGPVPVTPGAQQVTSPSPSTVVAGASSAQLYASFDGGHSWQTVYQNDKIKSWTYLGFTTPAQGVAIGSDQSRSVLLMTRDGGHHWAPVSFGATS